MLVPLYKQIGGPAALVGHSCGGHIITNSAHNNPNVTGLVHCLLCSRSDEGQSLSNLIDLTRLPKNLLIFDNGEFSTENPTLFHGALAQDVGPIADFMAIVLNTVAASEVSEGAIAIQFAHQYTNRV